MDIQKLCAVFSLQAYSTHANDNPVITGESGLPATFEGYTRIDNAGPSHDDYQDYAACGFYAEAWFEEATGELVIAFRGTDFNAPNLLDFWDANFPLAFGYTDAEQWVQAQAFVDKVLAENDGLISEVTFTGHSLGGGLAALASVKYGHESYVFSPAPFKSTADSFLFVPDGLDPAHEAVLRSAVTAYEATKIWPTSLPGLAAAVAARDALVASRCDASNGLIHTSRVSGEVLGEFFVNPVGAAELMTYLGATGQSISGLAAELFPAAAGTDIDIGGSTITVAESLARHGMALHLLLLDRSGFAELLQGDEATRKALLDSSTAPLSTETEDASSVRDMGVMFRAMYLDVDFYQSFMGASNVLHVSSHEQAVKDAFATLLVQKASLYVDDVRTGTNGIFDPLASTTGNAVIIGGIDVVNDGARNEHGNLVSHITADVHFRELLAQALIDGGHATSSYALALATATLGVNLYDFEPGEWSLPWAWMAVADGKGAVDIDLSAYEGTMIFGSGYDDVVKGSAWADFIYGDDGDDTIEGGAGADIIIGGPGKDTVSYLSSPSGVNVNLSVVTAQSGGHAGGDILIGIENVVGSSYNDQIILAPNKSGIAHGGVGNDIIWGGRESDRIYGDDGDDILYAYNPALGRPNSYDYVGETNLVGGSGVDTMYGAYGRTYFWSLNDGDIIHGAPVTSPGVENIVIFRAMTSSIEFDPRPGGIGNNITATNLTGVRGTPYDDIFHLAPGITTWGEDGNDLFIALDNGVRAFGGKGDDIFDSRGGVGSHYFVGGEGNDIFLAGNGYDEFSMNSGSNIFDLADCLGNKRLYNFDAGPGIDDIIILSQEVLRRPNGSLMSFSQFIDERAVDSLWMGRGYISINLNNGHYLQINYDNDTSIYKSQLAFDDFLFV